MRINGVTIQLDDGMDIHDLASEINSNEELLGIVTARVDGSRLYLYSETRTPLTVSGNGAERLSLAVQSANPDDAYRGRIAQLGAERMEANRLYLNQELLVDQLGVRKEAVSGVSLDEEMTNLVKYQHAYEAAAALTRVIDEMLDTIVNRLK